MPYSLPADAEPPPRAHHRRTRSASNFSDERGPGAFVSLGALPRTNKKALFHINVNDDDDDDPRHSPLANSLRLSVPPPRRASPAEPPSYINIPFHATQPAVPFPVSSPLSPSDQSSPFFPSSHRTDSSASYALSPSLPRTPSSSIILSNGKPLKPSLKSSSSSPNIPAGLFPPASKHLRAQSAPSTPAGPKNVHFAEDSGLESVRVFSRSGKPASLSKPPGEETETETEAEQPAAFPFPSIPSPTSPQPLYEADPDPARTSTVPTPAASPYAHVLLETLVLPRLYPPALRGSVVVRNVAFEKRVAVRFTLDDWQTTSEVLCHHVVSLPSLPHPFPQPRTVGDVAGSIAAGFLPPTGEKDTRSWDRFSFTIRLEDYEHKLTERTLFLAVRFAPGSGGEFWDNNNGANYRVAFRRAPATPPVAQTQAHSQQRTFSAPSTLRSTPASAGAPRGMARSVSLPIAASPSPPLDARTPRNASFPPPSPAPSQAGAYVAKRLSLSNYVMPTAAAAAPAPSVAKVSVRANGAEIATPPATPPGSARMRSASLPASAGLRADPPAAAPPPPDVPSAREGGSEESSPDAGTLSPLDFWGPQVSSGGAGSGFGMGLGIEFPASMEGVGASAGGQLLSPPSSPAREAEAEGQIHEHEHEHDDDEDDDHEHDDGHDEHELEPEQGGGGYTGMPLGFPGDSSYAALIRQWCFGGVGGNVVSPNTPGHGQVQGYGFPGWGFGVNADAGMVGAHMR